MRYLLLSLLLCCFITPALRADETPQWVKDYVDHGRYIFENKLENQSWDDFITANSGSVDDEVRALETMAFQMMVSMKLEDYNAIRPRLDELVKNLPDRKQHRYYQRALDIMADGLVVGDLEQTIASLTAMLEIDDLNFDYRTRILIFLIYTHYEAKDHVAAAKALNELRKTNYDRYSAGLRSDVLYVDAFISVYLGDYTRVANLSIDALKLRHKAGYPIQGLIEISNIVTTLRNAGYLDEARQVNAHFLALVDLFPNDNQYFIAFERCGHIELNAGNFQAALECNLAAEKYLHAAGFYRIAWYEVTVTSLLKTGDYERARQYLDRLRDDKEIQQRQDLTSLITRLDAELLYAEGRYSEAFEIMHSHMTEAIKEAQDGRDALAAEHRSLYEKEADLLQSRNRLMLIVMLVSGLAALFILTLAIWLWRNQGKLKAARIAADAASQTKSQFLANMSHEIRTPLNGVLGMARTLGLTDLNSNQRELLDVVTDSGKNLLAILNDILDISKIEAGRVEIEPSEFDLVDLVEKGRALYQAHADEKGLILSIEITEGAHNWFIGDAVRIRQVLHNLVSNALKFTERGRIDIKVSAENAENGPSKIYFRVRDSGPGMDATEQEKIFVAFQQGQAKSSVAGTGLGLPISRKLVRLMGGDLWVESEVGAGSEFIFFVECELSPEIEFKDRRAAAPIVDESDYEDIRILIADDHDTNRKVIRSILDQMNTELTLVTNGREAFEAYQTGEFDIVLSDIKMPEMTGKEALAAIRDYEAETGRTAVPIIAVTASAMTHQIEDYVEAGFDGHVPKPIEPEVLKEEINKVFFEYTLLHGVSEKQIVDRAHPIAA